MNLIRMRPICEPGIVQDLTKCDGYKYNQNNKEKCFWLSDKNDGIFILNECKNLSMSIIDANYTRGSK